MTTNTEQRGAAAGAPSLEPAMTIQTAKDFYDKFGDDIRQDMKSVVDLIRGSNVSEALCNSNYLHALAYTDLMLGHTQRSFLMLTGCAGGGFLTCLRDSFATMLARLKKHGGKAKIILVNSDSRGPLDDLKAAFPETLEFLEATAPSTTMIKHFIVSDDDMVRDEDYHPKLTDMQSAELIKAKVYFRNSSQASSLAQRFDTIWDHLAEKASV